MSLASKGPDWKVFAIELAIVVFGITGAFQIEKLDNDRRDAAAHETLLGGVISELDYNRAELDSIRPLHDRLIDGVESVAEILGSGDRTRSDELARGLRAVYNLFVADLQTGQIDTYLASDLTATSPLRPRLVDLRADIAALALLEEVLYAQTFDRVMPALAPYYDFAAARIVDADGVWGLELRNSVNLLVLLQRNYAQALADISDTLADVGEGLKQPAGE